MHLPSRDDYSRGLRGARALNEALPSSLLELRFALSPKGRLAWKPERSPCLIFFETWEASGETCGSVVFGRDGSDGVEGDMALPAPAQLSPKARPPSFLEPRPVVAEPVESGRSIFAAMALPTHTHDTRAAGRKRREAPFYIYMRKHLLLRFLRSFMSVSLLNSRTD